MRGIHLLHKCDNASRTNQCKWRFEWRWLLMTARGLFECDNEIVYEVIVEWSDGGDRGTVEL